MDSLEQKAVDILDKLEKLTTQYAPEVLDAAASAVRVTGIGNIITGIGSMVSAAIVIWIAKNFANICRKKKEEEGYMSEWELGMGLSLAVGGITGSVLSIVFLFRLLNIWNWIAIFNPKLALAHKILGL